MSKVAAVYWANFSILFTTILFSTIGGCGPSLGTVSGTVTVDGKPLENGVIAFVPADGNGVPITVDIKGGSYSVQTVAGKKRVQVSAPIVTGRRKEYDGPDAPLVDVTEESIPPKYNSDTELSFDLPAGASIKDWSLERIRSGKKQ